MEQHYIFSSIPPFLFSSQSISTFDIAIILLDENCASPETIKFLQRKEFNVYTISPDFKGCSDSTLFDICVQEGIHLLVTFDGGFAELQNRGSLIGNYFPIIYILPLRLQGNPYGITQHILYRISNSDFSWEDINTI